MFKNYLKTALLFLRKNKLFTTVNIIGLSIALSVSFLIMLYVINELSYDHMHEKRDKVFRVVSYDLSYKNTLAQTPYILASSMKSDFPQVEKAIQTRRVRGFKIKRKESSVFFEVDNPIATTSDVFAIFSFKIDCSNSLEHLLDENNAIVLSQSLAQKLFGRDDVTGEELVCMLDDEVHNFIVKAVYEDLPENSTFQAQCLVNSRWTLPGINRDFNTNNADVDWYMDFWSTYVLLGSQEQKAEVETLFPAFEKKYLGEEPTNNFHLQNLSDVYLKSENIGNSGITGNMKNIRLFSFIAVLIVIIAALNYILLSTTISSTRAKEIGIRKTSGASINSIRIQLFGEAIILSFLAFPVALVLVYFNMQFAGTLFQTQLQLFYTNVGYYTFVFLGITVLIGVFSGIYTAGYLSKLKVVSIMNNTRQVNKNTWFRSGLIFVELVIFCCFISCTLIIRSQYNFFLTKDYGYYAENVVFVNVDKIKENYNVLLHEIKSDPNVISAGGVLENLPMRSNASFLIPNFKDKDKMVATEVIGVDEDFMQTMGMKLIDGRYFSNELGTDIDKSVILNETAVRQLSIENPIGKECFGCIIVGVVKDFNLHALNLDIPPLYIARVSNDYLRQIAVHYNKGYYNEVITNIKNEWSDLSEDPMEYSTIEDIKKELYMSENNLSKIISISSLFTFLISVLGLFGLTLFLIKSRTKEIGIKKVLGCSERSIVYSFLHKNVLIVLAASIVSILISYYLMNQWLSNFAYKVNIDFRIFIWTFLIAMVVVNLTVLLQSVKASRLNPARALRSE